MIIIDAEKAWQSSTLIRDKNFQQSGYGGNILQHKSIYDKPTTNIILNGEKLKSF